MRFVFSILLALAITIPAHAAAPTTKPASAPATQPAAPEEEWEVSSAARDLLVALEKAGKKYAALKSNSVTYTVSSPVTGDTETRTGWIAFQRESTAKDGKTTPTKFRITFDTLQLGKGRKTKNKVDYIFDGQWLTIAKHKIKSMQRIQIAAAGEKIDALKIGQGPFPVPFGQKVEDIVPLLEATTREPKKGDPENTKYLKFVPRKKHKQAINFVRMEVWIDKDTNLPVRIISKDANKSITTVDFGSIDTETALKSSIFEMKKPLGWDLTVERKKSLMDLRPEKK